MIEITAIGRLVKNVERRMTPTGKSLSEFTVACDDGYGDNKGTIWLNVTAWEKQGELVAQYCQKGSMVYIRARLQNENGNPRAYLKKDGTPGAQFEATLSYVKFLSSPKQEQQQSAPVEDDDEIPW